MTGFEPFHSSVNRIPVMRQIARKFAKKGRIPGDLADDSVPTALDRLHAGRWSGSLDLRITARTPVVTGTQRTDERGRNHVGIPLAPDGRPRIAPTLIKGMLSHAYERVTSSRFRVFNQHDESLTYRADPASALHLVPVRVRAVGADGSVRVQLLKGTTDRAGTVADGKKDVPVMMAAALPDGPNRGIAFAPGFNEVPMVKLPNGRLAPGRKAKTNEERLIELTPHQRRIRFDASLCSNGLYAQWIVTAVYGPGGERIPVFRIDQREHKATIVDRIEDQEGYVYLTTPDSARRKGKRTFPDKKSERVFFTALPAEKVEDVAVDPIAVEKYDLVVGSYVDLGPAPTRNRCGASRQTGAQEAVRNRFATLLPSSIRRVGALAYAVLDDQGEVASLTPITVGRRAFDVSPWDLAVADGSAPLGDPGEASPADRLLGYVVQSTRRPPARADGGSAAGGEAEADAGTRTADGATVGGGSAAGNGAVALRGRLFVGPVSASKTVSHAAKVLTPLLQPRPSSARRFLTSARALNPAADARPGRDSYYRQGQLLGAAAYPVHRALLGCGQTGAAGGASDEDGFPLAATSLLNQNGLDTSEVVRMHVDSWLRTGSVLTCTVRFEDLTRDELAMLLWVLQPENLVPQDEQDDGRTRVGYLRMGLGKPLGLGVVEVRVEDAVVRAVPTCPHGDGDPAGAGLAADYASLGGCLGTSESAYRLDSFTTSFDPARFPWVMAFQRAAFGYSDGVDVRYMTLAENKANNQTDHTTGLPKAGCGAAPAPLASPRSPQPLQIAEPQSSRRKRSQKKR